MLPDLILMEKYSLSPKIKIDNAQVFTRNELNYNYNFAEN